MNPTIKPTFVYVILQQNSGGLCKLGVSAEPEDRRRTLQTGNPNKLTILAVWPGSPRLEKKLQRYFHEYKREGEWYALPPFSGLEIYRLVHSHHTESRPRLRKPPAVSSRLGFKSGRCLAHGIGIPDFTELRRDGDAFIIYSRYVDYGSSGERVRKRKYEGRIRPSEIQTLRAMEPDEQREFISQRIDQYKKGRKKTK